MIQRTYQLAGMNCGHCAGSVKEALSSIETVAEAKVNLEKQTAIIKSEIDVAPEIKAAVESTGFQFIGAVDND